MSIRFLSPVFKKIGYALLMISASLFFITTSGALTFFLLQSPPNTFENAQSICETMGLITFAGSIILIAFGQDKTRDYSLTNRLLLPHYFKYAGYFYLLVTIAYCATSKYTYRHAKNVKWYNHVILNSYTKDLTPEQKQEFDKLKSGGIVVHSSTIIVDPLTMILPVGLLFLAFAKEKIEDELISKYRTQSLQLAILLLFFLILYQKFYVPEIKTLILTGKQGIGYFDIPGKGWRSDILINIILAFCILRMEFMLRIRPLFLKTVAL